MIAFDNSTTKPPFTASSNFTHTCTGSERGLIVFVAHSSVITITGVKYNGVSMSSISASFAGSAGVLNGFYLANPASGSNTVAITGTGTGNSNSTAVAVSFTGVHQTQSKMMGNSVSFDHPNIDATSSSHAMATKYSGSMVIDCIMSDGNITTGATAGANQTSRWSQGAGFTHVGSTEPKTSPGSVNMAWTWTNTIRYGTILAEIRLPKKYHIMSY